MHKMIPTLEILILLSVFNIQAEAQETPVERAAISIPSDGLTLPQLSERILASNPIQ